MKLKNMNLRYTLREELYARLPQLRISLEQTAELLALSGMSKRNLFQAATSVLSFQRGTCRQLSGSDTYERLHHYVIKQRAKDAAAREIKVKKLQGRRTQNVMTPAEVNISLAPLTPHLYAERG